MGENLKKFNKLLRIKHLSGIICLFIESEETLTCSVFFGQEQDVLIHIIYMYGK